MRPYLSALLLALLVALDGIARGATIAAHALRRSLAFAGAILRTAARRARHYLFAMPGPCALALALSLTGCTAATLAKDAPPILALGTEACDALLPLALPGLGALDALVCQGAEKLIAEVIAEGQPNPPPAAMLAPTGGGAMPPSGAHPWRPLRLNGSRLAYVRAPDTWMAWAQGRLDARVVRAMPMPPVPGGAR